MTPFCMPNVENVSAVVKALRKLPMMAKPDGPIKTASILPAITPVIIFIRTLTALSEETLNRGLLNIEFKYFNAFKFAKNKNPEGKYHSPVPAFVSTALCYKTYHCFR